MSRQPLTVHALSQAGLSLWVFCLGCGRGRRLSYYDLARHREVRTFTHLHTLETRFRCDACGKRRALIWPDDPGGTLGLGSPLKMLG